MAQSTTPAFNAEVARDGQEPVLLLELYLTGETLYLASRRVTIAGTVYVERIAGGVEIDLSGAFAAGEDGGPRMGSVRIQLLNQDDVTGTPFSDYLATRTFTGRRAVLRQGYIDAAGAPLAISDCLTLIDGHIELPEDCFTDELFTLEIVDNSDTWHKEIGTRIKAADFPSAPSEAIGRMIPIVYGRVERAPAVPVDIGARSTLAADITDAATSCTLASASGFPSSGTVRIDEEEIEYTSVSGESLLGLTRGASPIPHDRGAAVVEVQSAYVFRLADHAVKTVHAVYVRPQGGTEEDWVRLAPTEYTVETV